MGNHFVLFLMSVRLIEACPSIVVSSRTQIPLFAPFALEMRILRTQNPLFIAKTPK